MAISKSEKVREREISEISSSQASAGFMLPKLDSVRGAHSTLQVSGGSRSRR